MSSIVFLRGAKTILRPFDKEIDARLFQRWVNDPDVRRFLLRVLPADLQEEERWIDSLSANEHKVALVIETEDNIPIGTLGLQINWVNGTAVSGAMIGEKKYWNRGYGSDAKMVLLYHAFCNLGLRKVCSSVLSFNGRSQAYLKRTGYRIEGVRKKQILRDGCYHDEILMAVFREEFMRRWKEYKKKNSL